MSVNGQAVASLHPTLPIGASRAPSMLGANLITEEIASYQATPMIFLALDTAGAAALDFFRRESAALQPATCRPFSIAVIDATSSTTAWQVFETAMADALAGMPIDARRRIGMGWEVILVSTPGPKATEIKPLLDHWAVLNQWPIRVTWLLDVAAQCRPWDSAKTADSWEALALDLRQLEYGIEGPRIVWNGTYLVGSGNRFGYATGKHFSSLYLVRLLVAFVASDLAGWLSGLPTFNGGDMRPAGSVEPVRLSAIGVSAFWHPALPWSKQVIAIQAARRARAHASQRRRGHPVTVTRWLRIHVDHEQQLTALEGRSLGHLLRYVELAEGNPEAQCREMVARVTDRAAKCQAPLKPTIEQKGATLLAQLQGWLTKAGQELMLCGSTEEFAHVLACLEPHLAALRQRQHLIR